MRWWFIKCTLCGYGDLFCIHYVVMVINLVHYLSGIWFSHILNMGMLICFVHSIWVMWWFIISTLCGLCDLICMFDVDMVIYSVYSTCIWWFIILRYMSEVVIIFIYFRSVWWFIIYIYTLYEWGGYSTWVWWFILYTWCGYGDLLCTLELAKVVIYSI